MMTRPAGFCSMCFWFQSNGTSKISLTQWK
jgi:hypothetical protein